MDRSMLIQTGLVLLACSLGPLVGAGGESAAVAPRLFPFRQSGDDGKWGYMDRQGATIIEPQFDHAREFADGLARVVLDGQRSYIDQQSAVQLTVPPAWRWTGQFSEGLAGCRVGDKCGFFDKQGEIVIQPRYDEVRDFREGLAKVSMYTEPPPTGFGARFHDRPTVSGYVDKQGREAIPIIYPGAEGFHEGLANVLLEGGVGYLDKRGNVVIRLDHDHDMKNRPKQYAVYQMQDFSEGLACIEISTAGGTEYRRLTKAGELLPREGFPRWFSPFHGGLASFKSNDTYGYIDRSGEIVCEPMFDGVGYFSEGLAVVVIGEQFGYIDRQMKFLIRPGESCPDGRGPLNDAEPFSGGLARVHIEGYFHRGFQVGRDWYFGAWFYMNEQGDLVRRIRHDDESGPGYGMEYRPYWNASEPTEEMKDAWEKLQSDQSAEERSADIGDLVPSLPKVPPVEQE